MDGPDKILVSCSQPGNHTSASPGCRVTCSGCSTCGRGEREGRCNSPVERQEDPRPTPLSSFPLPPLSLGRATIFSSLPPALRLCWYTSDPCASWLHREGGPSVATHYLGGEEGGSLTSQTLLALRRKKREREGSRLSCKLGSFHSSAQITSSFGKTESDRH